MQKSKASWILRSALKRRTRRSRRRQVVLFYLCMTLYPAVTAGTNHRDFWTLLWVLSGVWACLMDVFRWSRGEPLIVTSLDDRAQLAHGVNFEELTEPEQKEILRKYRVFRAVVDSGAPDERQNALRLRATESAFRFLRVALVVFAALYWAVYLWVPAGPWREKLMDSPVLISWLVVFVISLPQMIFMWTEPDAVGEPRPVLDTVHP